MPIRPRPMAETRPLRPNSRVFIWLLWVRCTHLRRAQTSIALGARGATACHFPRVRSLAAFGRRLRCKPHRCIRRHPKPSTIAVIRACPLFGTLPHVVENLGVDESATYLKQLRCAGRGRFVARPPRPVALLQPAPPSHGMPSGCDVRLQNWGSAAEQFSPTGDLLHTDQ